MKQFVADRTGQTPTLVEVPNEKIPIYDSLSDAEADIANIEENQIVATKDVGAGDLLHTVDTVQSGNIHPVTSNAVYNALFDVQELTFIPSSTYTDGFIEYVKQGPVVTIMGWVYAPNPTSTSRIKIANVPRVGQLTLALLSAQNTTTGNVNYSVEIETNELFVFTLSSGDAGYVRFNGSYITSDI